ncbi:MAG: undecaprenyl-diphosphate phosphatase [Nanoarchaeota archaeon]
MDMTWYNGDFLSLILLAVVQGFAEWVPVSSSSQIEIVSHLIGYQSSLFLEVALHFGTLMAVFVYFGKEIMDILRDVFSGNWKSEEAKLGFAVIIAAIPAGIAGFFLKGFLESNGGLGLVACGLGITSMILFIGSISPKKDEKFSYGKALLIGVAQILALFRGVSRSGSTIVTGLLLGLSEKNAVKFSFLLSIPIIFGANLLNLGNKTLPSSLFFASLVSFAVGISTIHFSFKYLLSDRKNLKWFAWFTLIEAIVIGGWVIFGKQ